MTTLGRHRGRLDSGGRGTTAPEKSCMLLKRIHILYIYIPEILSCSLKMLKNDTSPVFFMDMFETLDRKIKETSVIGG